MKDTKSWAGLFLLAVLAGVSIGIGCTIYLSMQDSVLGAFLFSIGLITILVFGWKLFTGQIGYTDYRKPRQVAVLAVIWAGNFVGTYVTSLLISFTRQGEKVYEKALKLVHVKLDDSFISLFILGIFCGMLMFVAVDSYRNNPHPVGKYLAIMFSVMVFILSGFEHCIADMFYFMISGTLVQGLPALLVITVGNALGGGGCSALSALARRMTALPEPVQEQKKAA